MKLTGAIIIIGCSLYFGLQYAAGLTLEIGYLKKLICAIDYMSCELQYKLTPLPDLCRQTAGECSGHLKALFMDFADELDNQVSPNVKLCMSCVLARHGAIPKTTRKCLEHFSSSMGRFDLKAQIRALEAVRIMCRKHVEDLENGKETRVRIYKTLGICAGAAVVILLV